MVIFNSYVKLPEGNDVQLVICSQPDIYSTRMWYHQPTTDLCFKVFQAPPPHVDRQFTTALPNFLHFLFGLVKSRCFYPYDPYVDTSWYAMINIYKLQCIYIYVDICIYICVYIYICTTLTWAFQLGPSIKFAGPLLRSYSSSRLDAPDFYGEDQSLIKSNYSLANKHSYWQWP